MRRAAFSSLVAIAAAGLVASALWVAMPKVAVAEPRIALVIGNSAYKSAPLRNPGNDAALMAESLEGLGFQVAHRNNLDQRRLKRAIRDFGQRLERAGENAVGLFYYSGHGVQVGDRNYLKGLSLWLR